MTYASTEAVPVQRPSGTFRTVDLASYADCVGIEPGLRPGTGGFNIWWNTFPAEELPLGGSTVTVAGVPFLFPNTGTDRPDNLRCRGQRIALPAGRVDWVYALAAAERRTEDVLTVHYADGAERPQWLRVSDFWPETPCYFGETLAFRTSAMLYPRHRQEGMAPSIWCQRVPVTVPLGVVALTLPDNPAMHVFALTLCEEASR